MPIKTYEQVQAEQQAQLEQQRQASNKEHEAFVQRVEAWRANPTPLDRSTLPTWEGYYQQKATEEQAAAEEAERQRIAALTPRQVWMSTLNGQDRDEVLRWQGVNKGQLYPVPGLEEGTPNAEPPKKRTLTTKQTLERLTRKSERTYA